MYCGPAAFDILPPPLFLFNRIFTFRFRSTTTAGLLFENKKTKTKSFYHAGMLRVNLHGFLNFVQTNGLHLVDGIYSNFFFVGM